MAERKWDELNKDCLVQIFARVGTESLTVFIPFVCKPWYRATFDPQCWTTLRFPRKFDLCGFVEYAVGRSQSSATAVLFEPRFDVTREELLCIAKGCPLLKALALPYDSIQQHSLLLSELISNWKHLEWFKICTVIHFEQIMESISLHCDRFVGLVCNGSAIGNEHVLAIVKFTPKIKYLVMKSARLPRYCLVMLLKGCAALEVLDVSDCIGFEESDDEIMKLASHIKSFKCSGAMLFSEDEYPETVTYRDSVLFDDEYNSD